MTDAMEQERSDWDRVYVHEIKAAILAERARIVEIVKGIRVDTSDCCTKCVDEILRQIEIQPGEGRSDSEPPDGGPRDRRRD